MTTDTTNLESMEVAVSPTLVAESRGASGPDPTTIGPAVATAFQKVEAFLKANAITAAGAPRVTYAEWGPSGVTFTAAIPIAGGQRTVLDTPDVSIKSVPESTALRFVHRGPYRDVRHTYGRIEAWLRERGGIKTVADWARYAPMWEEYMNDPATTPESELVTRIYLTLP